MSEVTLSPGSIVETKEDMAQQQRDAALQTCLDALLYEEGVRRPFTLNTLKLLEEIKPKLGKADCLFIDGVAMLDRVDTPPFKYFSQAEEAGCDHPLLPYFMARCYRSGEKGVIKSATKALACYTKAIEGGCSLAYQGIYLLYAYGCEGIKGNKERSGNYLLELEMEGIIDGSILQLLGYCNREAGRCGEDESIAITYYQRAIDLGFTPACLALYRLYCFGTINCPRDHDKAVLTLIEVEKNGIAHKDDRVLSRLIQRLMPLDTNLSAGMLGTFKNKGEMILRYCDTLISRGSPLGYYHKGYIYMHGKANIPQDMFKAVSLWEEADKVGLAHYDIYYLALADAYTHGSGAPVDGNKVLWYYERALQCITDSWHVSIVLCSMAEVYEKGIYPISQDGNKAIEWYQRALEHAYHNENRIRVYRKMVTVYREGIPPLAPNLEKVEELKKIIDAIQDT